MEIIKKNNYVPNLVAKGLRTQKMKNVGIIVPDITNEFFMKLVYEIEKNLFPKAMKHSFAIRMKTRRRRGRECA